MALYNEILVGRYNRFIQKLFSMKGGAPAPQLSSDIQMVLAFFTGAGLRYLEGWDQFAGFESAGPNVAGNSAVRLRNPVGSNVLAEVFKLRVYSTTLTNFTLNIRLSPKTTDLTSPVSSSVRMDARSIRSSALIMSFDTNVANAGGVLLEEFMNAADTGGRVPRDLIVHEGQTLTLLPGDALDMETSVVNVNLFANWWWRERPLEASEITQ